MDIVIVININLMSEKKFYSIHKSELFNVTCVFEI